MDNSKLKQKWIEEAVTAPKEQFLFLKEYKYRVSIPVIHTSISLDKKPNFIRRILQFLIFGIRYESINQQQNEDK